MEYQPSKERHKPSKYDDSRRSKYDDPRLSGYGSDDAGHSKERPPHDYRKVRDDSRSPPAPPPYGGGSDDSHRPHHHYSRRVYEQRGGYDTRDRKYDKQYPDDGSGSDEAMDYMEHAAPPPRRGDTWSKSKHRHEYDAVEYPRSSRHPRHRQVHHHPQEECVQAPVVGPSSPLLPMDTDVISSEEDEILGAKSSSNSPDTKKKTIVSKYNITALIFVHSI